MRIEGEGEREGSGLWDKRRANDREGGRPERVRE